MNDVYKKDSILFLKTIFTSPKDAMDMYLNNPEITRSRIYLIILYLFTFIAGSKIIYNFIASVILPNPEAANDILVDIHIPFIAYTLVFGLVIVLDSLRISYEERAKIIESPIPDLLPIAFIPFFSTSIFWLLPPPYLYVFPLIGFLYSTYLGLSFLKIYSKFTFREYIKYLLFVGVFFLILALIAIAVLKLYLLKKE